ncbi:MAG: exosortase E/protease, VPEID-CTERM system [Isosphaeraceae bacterium]
MGTAVKVGAATAAAILIFSGRRLREEFHDRAGPSPWRWSWPALAGHLAVVAIFGWLCGRVFEGTVLDSNWSPAWAAAWVSTGLASMLLLVATVLPPGLWGLSIRTTIVAAAAGLTVGIASMVAGWLTSLLWRPLGRCTLDAVHVLLGLVTTDLAYDPANFVVGTASFAVNIAPQCSGYEGIGMVWAFLGAYLWIDRRHLRFPRAWLVLPFGALVMWSVNVARIASLVALGTWFSADVAVEGFHSQAGWLGFIAVALGLLLLMQGTGTFLLQDVRRSAPVHRHNPEAVYLTPLIAIVAAGMVGAAFSSGGFDRYYPTRLAAVAVPLWIYRRQYAGMRWVCSWEAVAIGVLVFALWIVRWPGGLLGPTSDQDFKPIAAIGLGNIWLAARAIGSVVTVPLAEELAFRGFLARRLMASDFDTVAPGRLTWASIAVSSLAFGVLHDRWLEGTAAGMLYALAYRRRGSIGDAVVAHATTNALLSAGALISGDWSLFS